MRYCIGIDVGGTSVKLGIFETDGKLLEKWEIKTRRGGDGKLFIADTADSILAHLAERRIALSEVAGAGMGVPGPVLAQGYVEVCVNLGLRRCYPAGELSERLSGMKVSLANDANIAALGEMWQGAGKGQSSICMVTLGTGVGGGIVDEGRIVSGVHGAGGEIGHMHVLDGEKEACNCGGHGCLEQYASATGIVRVAKRMLQEEAIKAEEGKQESPAVHSAMASFGDALSAKDVCDCAKAGDALALKALHFSIRQLALILSHVAMCTDPKLYIIGGGVSRAGSFLCDLVEEELKRLTPLIKDEDRRVVLAELGNDAGIYGGARLALME